MKLASPCAHIVASLLVTTTFGVRQVATNTPATPEEVLCGAVAVVDATVVSASKLSCRATAADGHCIQTAWYDATQADIRVERVLALNQLASSWADGIVPGTVYPVSVGYVPLSPSRAVAQQELVRRLIAEGRPVSEDEGLEWIRQSNIADFFVGNRFLFSLSGPRRAASPNFGAKVWLLSDESWILKTLASRNGNACARPF